MRPADPRSAAVVIHVWRDEDDEPLRARITILSDPVAAPESMAVSGAPAVLAAVRRWLETFGGEPLGLREAGPCDGTLAQT
jgi:hypothetical protein